MVYSRMWLRQVYAGHRPRLPRAISQSHNTLTETMHATSDPLLSPHGLGGNTPNDVGSSSNIAHSLSVLFCPYRTLLLMTNTPRYDYNHGRG
jgi:hypothetical protein